MEEIWQQLAQRQFGFKKTPDRYRASEDMQACYEVSKERQITKSYD
jgi:hypothetical protein